MFAAFDHDDKGVVRQGEVHEVCAVGEEGVGDFYLGHGGFDFFREFHAEVIALLFLLLCQPEQPCRVADRGALGEEGDDGDEEYNVEYQVGAFNFGDEGVGGEDDGHSPSQSHPGDVGLGFRAHPPEGGEAEEDAGRTGEQHHEDADQQAQPGDRQQFVGVDEKPEREEHDDLEEPSEAVKESHDALLVLHLVVPDHEPGDIDGEVAVAFDELRDGEDEEHARKEEDGVEGLVADVEPVYHEHDKPPEQVAGDGTHAHLDDEHEERVPQVDFVDGGLYDLDEQEGEHVCHGVVAPAFQFEERAQLLFQSLPFAAQDGENGCGIRGGHDGCHEQRAGDGEGGVLREQAAEPIDEQACEGCGQYNSQRGKDDALPQYRSDFREFGVHASGEKDDAQCNHANELGAGGVVELDAQAVAAEEHADTEEKQEDGHPETGTGFSDNYAKK